MFLRRPVSPEKHVSTGSLYVPVKIKDAVVHATKAYRRSRDVVPLIHNVGARWRWVVNFTPRPLVTAKESSYPLNRKVWALDAVWTL
jgi:hypothetical protein